MTRIKFVTKMISVLFFLLVALFSCELKRRSLVSTSHLFTNPDLGPSLNEEPEPPIDKNSPLPSTDISRGLTPPRSKRLGSILIDLDWPVDEARLTRGFFYADPKQNRKRPHLGIDLANRKGTPILSSHSGKVVYAGSSFRGFGRMVMIEDNGQQFATLYAHLFRILVKPGQKVARGTLIGLMGKSGRSFGVHLHFELRTLTGPVDPIPFLPEVPALRKLLGESDGINLKSKKIVWVGKSFADEPEELPSESVQLERESQDGFSF